MDNSQRYIKLEVILKLQYYTPTPRSFICVTYNSVMMPTNDLVNELKN